MLFNTWGNQIQTLCLLPLMSGDTMLGVLKLAQCEEKVFTTTNLNLLRQIAERVAIAVDNALAYQEIHRLKERLVDENLALTEQLNNVDSEFGEIIGRSEAMYSVLKQVEMVAQSDSTVLILGETGTGKELIARAIHNLSGRNNRRMVKMNCAAMPAVIIDCWKAIYLVMSAGLLPVPALSALVVLNWRIKAHYSSMKWAICRWSYSRSCCVYYRNRSLNVSAATKSFRRTYV
ncbi:hypothetical protein EIMP300_30680 [Escherichia coli]|uniref:Sigma-54 factor interaction domain-containing protein n=1 Tax=Escherichia coli TaxID=562 RepID=A0A8S0FNX4_ECOLX|nr:hypothetical protein EIMP300_30680 [Escherichia coli]